MKMTFKDVNGNTVIQWNLISDLIYDRIMDRMTRKVITTKGDHVATSIALIDAGNMVGVCSTISEGSWSKAKSQIQELDTSVREQLIEIIEDVVGVDFNII